MNNDLKKIVLVNYIIPLAIKVGFIFVLISIPLSKIQHGGLFGLLIFLTVILVILFISKNLIQWTH